MLLGDDSPTFIEMLQKAIPAPHGDYIKGICDELYAAYNQPHRHYHTLAHLNHFASQLLAVANWQQRRQGLTRTARFGTEEVRPFTEREWLTLLLALGAHDAVYETHAMTGFNEALSLAWAKRVFAPLHGLYDPQLLENCIDATVHHKPADDWRVQVFSMADMSIFLGPYDRYGEYRGAILREYTGTTERRIRTNTVPAFRVAGVRGYLKGRREWLEATFGKTVWEHNKALAGLFVYWPLPGVPEAPKGPGLPDNALGFIEDELGWLYRLESTFTQT